MNKVILVGTVKDVKEKLWNDRVFLNFKLETIENYKDKTTNEIKSWSTWVPCVFENRDVFISVGDKLFVDGKYSTRQIMVNGEKTILTEIKCMTVEKLNSEKKDDTPVNDFGPPPLKKDEIPF